MSERTLPSPRFVLANVSRRRVLKGLAAAGGLIVAAEIVRARAFWAKPKWGAERGQGAPTSMPAIVADGLEADWERVRVAQAPADEAKYGNQDTDGSRSI